MTQNHLVRLSIAAIGLSIAFGAGAIWAGGTSGVAPVAQIVGSTEKAPATKPLSTNDSVVRDAEEPVNLDQIAYDDALAHLEAPAPSRQYVPDPEIQMGERHAIELNEQICRQTGQNCEFAKMARRQYQEKHASR